MLFFKVSPLTEKRLQRFRRSRVAFWSLRLLILLYAISLISELICNAKPLMMRFNGELSFPFLHSQLPDEIQKATGETRHVDYRVFVKSESFTKNASNFAVFAPIHYSPSETLDTADLEKDKVVTLALVPHQPIGRFNITRELDIIRQDSCQQFFPGVNLRDGTANLSDLLDIPPALKCEINRRLLGEACAAYEIEVSPMPLRSFPWKTLILTLAPNEKDMIPPSLRINLRLPLPNGQRFLAKREYAFKHFQNENGTFDAPTLISKDNVPDALLTQLLPWATQGFIKDITAADGISYLDTDSGTDYTVYSTNNIRFPFPPTRHHLFGLDGSGRDVFARILYATRIAMSFGLVLAISATLIGLIIGSLQGFFGGKLDICVQRFSEIWAALPFLYIMVLVGAIFGRSFWLLLLCYGLFCWIGLSYYMRAEFLRLRNRPFVDAARCQGLGNTRIIFRHILPNALTPIITLFPFLLVGAISALVSLDFLGFGLPPLTPSWGELLNQAQTYRWAWWLILFPSLAIFTVMFLTVMVGEGVRNAFDPKPYSKLQ
ncbi:MAG: ABC transporter permease subunit [Kiritimatiellia bacterium]